MRSKPPDTTATTDSDAFALPEPTANHDEWESCFVSRLGLIDSIVLAIGRRRGLRVDDAADLASMVRMRLMADDYAVLRKFERRASLKTYLTIVINRMLLDERMARLGKWRPSRQALRLGRTAVDFERLTLRDGFTFEEACSALEINCAKPIDRTALERLCSRTRLPARQRMVAADPAIEEVAAPSGSPDECLIRAECAALLGRTRLALARALGSLRAPDRHLVHLRFARGLSIADIARKTGLKQKALYGRCERLMHALRSRLERDGFEARDILESIGRADIDVLFRRHRRRVVRR